MAKKIPKTRSKIAAQLGRKGGKIGGKKRWEGVSDEQRSKEMKEIARRGWETRSRKPSH